jgi:hypothetical protein
MSYGWIKSYGTWIKSKNDISVSNDSDGQVEILKDEHEIGISSTDVLIDGKNVRTEMALKETSKLKSWFNPIPTKFIENFDLGR